jgi:GTP:adenosylcobinamide-phosphate guanylyltransferase
MPPHTMWKKVVDLGEQKINQFASQLMSNEAVVEGVQDLLKKALAAKEQAVTTTKTILKALNVPTLDDVKRVEDKLADIEGLFSEIRSSLESKS